MHRGGRWLERGGCILVEVTTPWSAERTRRCYSPADLVLLLEGTGLDLDGLEIFDGDGYEPAASLDAAKLYLARLIAQA